MAKEERRQPELRFKGFTDDWEQRKLQNILEVNSGKDYKHLNDGDIPVYGTGGLMLQVNEALSYDQDAIGIGRKGTIDKPFLLKSPFWTVDTLFYCIPKINSNLFFIYGVFQKINWKKMDESTGVPSLSKNTINNISINIPTLNEQNRIGKLLIVLDKSLALHQRKLDNLIKLKKAYLQLLHPDKSHRVPKLRFNNFSEVWEQRKASDIFESISDKNHADLPVLSASQEKGMILRSEIGIDIKYNENSLKNYKRVCPGQFVIHLRSFQGGFAYSNVEGITSPAYTILDFKEKNEHYPLYWSYLLNSQNFIQKLETITYGIRDGRTIKFSDFITLRFNIPKIKEQIKIGNLLQTLDKTVDFQQKNLVSLEQFKKSFLQLLFV